jgi:hypothetical protein
MTETDKRSLIFESVVATWIDIHPAEKEPDQHVHTCDRRGLTYDNHSQVPTKSKSGFYSRDEVLAPGDVWSGRHLGLTYSPSNKPPWSREGRFDKVVTKAIRFTGPHKIRYGVSTNQNLSLGPKWPVLNRHRRVLSHINLGIATTLSPSFPFECFTDPLIYPARSQQ